MKEMFKDETFLARWLEGKLTPEELAEFEAHEDFELYKKIAESSGEMSLPAYDKSKAWDTLDVQMSKAESKQEVKIRRIPAVWTYIAAASLIFAIAYFGFFRQGNIQTYQTAAAEQLVVPLPDGSEVKLNAGSSLSFNKKRFLEDRKLDLQGEAFFEVTKGESFLVSTQNGTISVLGTSFNVYSRNDKINLTCFTGSVGLDFGNPDQMEVLQPGDKIAAVGENVISRTKTAGNPATPSWINGQSLFEQADIIEVVEELERQFNVKIKYPSELLDTPKYTGGFPHNELETALNVIFSSINYQYKINGKEVDVFR
ncbi:MAG: FecR domain-containing protein [Bacteroidota bacterium]